MHPYSYSCLALWIDPRYKFSILDNISTKSDTSQNLVSSFLFTSADLLTTVKLFLANVKEDVTMRDRNTDHGIVKLELEFLAQNRNVLYEETGVYM